MHIQTVRDCDSMHKICPSSSENLSMEGVREGKLEVLPLAEELSAEEPSAGQEGESTCLKPVGGPHRRAGLMCKSIWKIQNELIWGIF